MKFGYAHDETGHKLATIHAWIFVTPPGIYICPMFQSPSLLNTTFFGVVILTQLEDKRI